MRNFLHPYENTVVASYKAGNLVAYKAGHLAAYKATHPSIWVRQLLPIRPHTPKFDENFCEKFDKNAKCAQNFGKIFE